MANINEKNCSLSIVLTTMVQKLQKSLKKIILLSITLVGNITLL